MVVFWKKVKKYTQVLWQTCINDHKYIETQKWHVNSAFTDTLIHAGNPAGQHIEY